MRALLKRHGISAAVVDAHITSTRHTGTGTALPTPSTIHPIHRSSWREAQSGGLQSAARPLSEIAKSAARNGLSTETSDSPRATTHLEAGNPSTEQDLILADRAHQETCQSYISPPTQNYKPNLDHSEPDPTLSLSHDLSQQKTSYPSTPSLHNHSTDDNDQMLPDDRSYNTQGIQARTELLTPVSSSNASPIRCSTTRIADNAPTDETDCEHAARIIASMRGHGDHESLWPELGCSVERNCMIKNIRLFQMA